MESLPCMILRNRKQNSGNASLKPLCPKRYNICNFIFRWKAQIFVKMRQRHVSRLCCILKLLFGEEEWQKLQCTFTWFFSMLGITNFRIISSDNNWLVLVSELVKFGEVDEVLPDSPSVVRWILYVHGFSTKRLKVSKSMVDNWNWSSVEARLEELRGGESSSTRETEEWSIGLLNC